MYKLALVVFLIEKSFGLVPIELRSPRRLSSRLMAGVVAEIQSDDPSAGTQKKFMFMTGEQDRQLKELGDREAALMGRPSLVKANKVRAGSGGFGSGGAVKGKEKKKEKKIGGGPDLMTQAQSHAKVLTKDGLVRIDNVLTPELADNLRNYLIDLRTQATRDVESGVIQDSQERFADVLLNQNRCDLKIPIGPEPVNEVLHHILHQTCIRSLLEYVFNQYGGNGDLATLYELNCFMSNAGARRQLVHADNVEVTPTIGLEPAEPIMLTCFIALQDTDESMGPTVWIPGTHNSESHRAFFETDDGKERILKQKSVVGAMPKGSCVVFDPRTLHCAGANLDPDPDRTRALFYISFKNPRVDDPGCPSCSGYGVAAAEISISALADELDAARRGAPVDQRRRIEALASFP